MNNHLIDTTIAAADLSAITDALNTVEQKLGFTLVLDDRTRNRLSRMGLRNETFSRGVLDVAKKNPALVPPKIDLAAMDRDVTLREELLPVLYQLQRLTRMVEDTAVAAGADAYDVARSLYKTFKALGSLSGIGDVVDELGERFAGQGPRGAKADEQADMAAAQVQTAPAGE